MTVTLARESRSPGQTGAAHQDALDGVRAVAIALVILTHVAAQTGDSIQGGLFWSVIGNGTIGVPIFFTLSGLLLYRPWARALVSAGPLPPARPYLWRRALRILPAYWVMLPIVMILLNSGHAGSLRTWFEMVTLTQNYAFHPWWGQGIGPQWLGPIWSLSVEVSFYLALPPLARWLHRLGGVGPEVDVRVRRVLAALVGLSAVFFLATFGVRLVGDYWLSFYWEHLLPRLLPYFLMGMAITLCAEWVRASETAPVAGLVRLVGAMPGVCWIIAGCTMVLAATPLATPLVGQGQNAWQCLAMIVMFEAAAVALIAPVAFSPDHPLVLAALGNPVMRRVGLVSYGIFLWHDPVMGFWFRLTNRPVEAHDFLLMLCVTGVGGWLVAELSHRFVERPALLLRDRVPALRLRDQVPALRLRDRLPPGRS
jgi:peptidoglycan/LPS O-acetylase OafA/YrhL